MENMETRMANAETRLSQIETRMDGHIPDKCIRTDEAIRTLFKRIGEIQATQARIFERLDGPGLVFRNAAITASVGAVVAFLVTQASK